MYFSLVFRPWWYPRSGKGIARQFHIAILVPDTQTLETHKGGFKLGLVGKAPGRYNMYLGGNRAGTRVPKQHLENATTVEILTELDRLIERWSMERTKNEEFGDFVIRAGVVEEIKSSATDFWE